MSLSAPTRSALLGWRWRVVALTAVARADEYHDLQGQFNAHYAARRLNEAEKVGRRMLALAEKASPAQPTRVAGSACNLATVLTVQGRYAEAEPLFRRALAIYEKALEPDPSALAATLTNLANLLGAQARWGEAEAFHKRGLAIREKTLGPDHPTVAASLLNLATLYDDQGRYTDEEPLLKRALAIWEKAFGRDHPAVAGGLNNLAVLYRSQGKYAEAEPIYRRALAIRRKALGPEHPEVAATLNNLANLLFDESRCAEAEPLYKQALAIHEKTFGPDHLEVATSLNNLANFYEDRGHGAEAEPLHRRALAIREKTLGHDHPQVANSLVNLANVYYDQTQYAEAEPLYRRALAIKEKALGPAHPHVAGCLNNLADVYYQQSRYPEAEAFYQRALAIREKALGRNHPDVAGSLVNLANVYLDQRRYADAEPLYRRAMAIREKLFGPQHPDIAYSLLALARLDRSLRRMTESQALLDRAIAILQRSRVYPDVLLKCLRLRAEVAWQAGRRDPAVADLRLAMDLAEQLRAGSSGTTRQRAQFFGHFADVFAEMAAWQTQRGNVDEVFSAIERSRARSLLDEMALGGVDLGLGRPAAEREALERREGELKARAAGWHRQWTLAKTDRERERLETDLAATRDALYQLYRQQRITSPVYRNLLLVEAKPPRLAQLRGRLLAHGALLLEYSLGPGGSTLLTADAVGARAVALTTTPSDAQTLGIPAGPLTARGLGSVLVNDRRTGIVQQLANPRASGAAGPRLAALWRVLVPEPERQALLGGKYRRLIVVPDGPLALLPLETLVIGEGRPVRWLLDAGPPILYGPSATVLFNLMERKAAVKKAGEKPVLSVGDPDYSGPAAEGPPEKRGQSPFVRSTLRAVPANGGCPLFSRGPLARLPFSGWESNWVAEVFRRHGFPCIELVRQEATKAAVAANMPGRRVLHLACHGFAEESYGNLFGGLVFAPTPPAAGAAADDGLLTLAEIYGLELGGCELTILSACETNFGPQQTGEGVWALSRGFLVAGSRRVVASDWLVDDEAAARLVGYFSNLLAEAQSRGGPVDYAAALQQAKRWVRRQEKWQSPFCWAPLVLVGPD